MNAILQKQYGPEVVQDFGDIATPVPAQRTTMQAIVQDKYGSSSVLELRSIDKPEIGVDDVLVRVRASGVHIGDLHVMTGQPYLMRIVGFGLRAPKARVRGMDVAGTVEAIGSNVTQFRAGDDVYGTCDGAFAEYASARADTLAPKPSNLTFEQPAAVPHGAITALQGLRDTGGIKPDHHLDAPWRPMDVEQRDGRGKRQGNEVYGPVFDTAGTLIDPGQGIRIFLYVTARSFDGYVWVRHVSPKSRELAYAG